jgi:hypothetical protein
VTVDDIMSVLDSRGMKSEDWLAACLGNNFEVKEKRFEDLRANAKKFGRAKLSKRDNKWYPTDQENVERNA